MLHTGALANENPQNQGPDPGVAQQVEAPEEKSFPLTVPIFDVDAPVGTVGILLTPSGEYQIPRASLLKLIEGLAGAERAAQISAKLPDTQYIRREDAANAGFTLTYDPGRVALVLRLPVADRLANEIAISRPPSVPEPTEARVEPAKFSAYTNFAFGVGNDPGIGGSETSATLRLQSAVRMRNFVIENEAFLETGEQAGRTLSRSATRISYDIPTAGIRASAGDIFTTSRGFTRSEDILGVSVFKNVEIFNPFAATRPTGKQSFTLARSANVDIFINNQLVQQVRLPPGSYDLTNFAQLDGANDIRIETRDDLGELNSFNFTSFFDSDLLVPGMAEWQINAGVRSLRSDRQITYDFGEPVVSGFYRRGVSETLTLGGSAELRENRALIGAEIVNANRLANVSLDIAASYTDKDIGAAIAFTLQPRLPEKIRSISRSFDVFAELTSRNFGDNPFNGLGESARFGFRYTDLIMNGRVSLSATGSYTTSSNARRDGYEASLSLGYRFENGFVARVTPNYRQSTSGRSEAAVRFSLTKSFGPRIRSRATYDTRDNRALAEFDYISQFGGVGTYGINVAASRADNEDGNLSANANYIGNRFEANANYTQIIEGNEAFDRGRISASFETAIAFADGEFAIGRPINDSFAIATKHPSLGNRQVIIDPAVNDRGDRARSGALGPALVSNLGSYSISKPSYTVDGLPIGYDLGTGIFEFFPPNRSGYSVEVGNTNNASLIGTAIGKDGQPLSLVRGKLTSTEDANLEEKIVFTNKAGRFGLLGLKPGAEYRIDIPEANFTYLFRVPETVDVEDANSIFNLGEIKSNGSE